jgi:hypothetical protein
MHIAQVKAKEFKKFKGRSFLPTYLKDEVTKALFDTRATEIEITQPFDYKKGELEEGTMVFTLHKLSSSFSGACETLVFHDIDSKKLAKIISLHKKKGK